MTGRDSTVRCSLHAPLHRQVAMACAMQFANIRLLLSILLFLHSSIDYADCQWWQWWHCPRRVVELACQLLAECACTAVSTCATRALLYSESHSEYLITFANRNGSSRCHCYLLLSALTNASAIGHCAHCPSSLCSSTRLDRRKGQPVKWTIIAARCPKQLLRCRSSEGSVSLLEEVPCLHVHVLK